MRIPGSNLSRRRRYLLALAIALLAGIAFVWWAYSTPALPGEYAELHLGMPRQEVDGILAAGSFRTLAGLGFSGWQKDEQQTKECADLRWTDVTKWSERFQRVTWWRQDAWSIAVTFDADGNLAGKSLVLMDS